jgi:hypothetical protein
MAKPVGARSRVTWKTTSRGRKMQGPGQPGTSSEAIPRSGEPRQLGASSPIRRRMRDSRQLGTPSPAKPEDAGFGATRRLIVGDTAERRTGATRSFINGTAEKREIRGNSDVRSRHSRMDRRFGATRRFVASTAEGCGVRGNPEPRRWPSGKMQGAGQLGSSSIS